MSHIEKEKLIKADIRSIENRVRHAFYQGYDLGFKDDKGKTDYETKLKAEKMAMLTELKSEVFFELAHADADGIIVADIDDFNNFIQQKINELKGVKR